MYVCDEELLLSTTSFRSELLFRPELQGLIIPDPLGMSPRTPLPPRISVLSAKMSGFGYRGFPKLAQHPPRVYTTLTTWAAPRPERTPFLVSKSNTRPRAMPNFDKALEYVRDRSTDLSGTGTFILRLL